MHVFDIQGKQRELFYKKYYQTPIFIILFRKFCQQADTVQSKPRSNALLKTAAATFLIQGAELADMHTCLMIIIMEQILIQSILKTNLSKAGNLFLVMRQIYLSKQILLILYLVLVFSIMLIQFLQKKFIRKLLVYVSLLPLYS